MKWIDPVDPRSVPPGTIPADPNGTWHCRGYHPHFDRPGAVQSVTFRLFDSVPAHTVRAWREELGLGERVARGDARLASLRARIDRYEDAGRGACFLRDPRIASLVERALLHFDSERYRLLEWCVMPNHVHGAIEILPCHRLGDIVHSWKSFTAKAANSILQRRGAFWMADYHDRFVRDERHLRSVRAYVRNNPVKAGLCERAEDWRFGSARRSPG